MASTANAAFSNLAGHNFMSLTTYRKSGEGVPTPVWFAQQGDRLYVVTQSNAYKVKRINNNPSVMVTPCTASGQLLGESASGTARVLNESEGKTADAALNAKYGIQKRLFQMMWTLRRITPVYLEIRAA